MLDRIAAGHGLSELWLALDGIVVVRSRLRGKTGAKLGS